MSTEENILVCIRIRPLTQAERKSGESPVWRTEGNTIISKPHEKTPERKREASPSSSSGNSTITTPLKGSRGATIARPANKTVGTRTPTGRRTPTSKSTPTRSTRPRSSLSGTPSTRTPQRTPTQVNRNSPAPSTPMYATAKPRVYSYSFDRLFRPSETTQEVYERMAEGLVWSAMDGFNATIFAYGQTGSGKTFTMKGNLRRSPGIIPLAVQDLFEYIKQTPEREFLLRVSYFEIYNEIINDLLEPSNQNLSIRESRSKGIYVENLREEIVRSPEKCMSLLAAGESNRKISATTFNKHSSRSHTIFRVVIESKDRAPIRLGDDGPASQVFVKPRGQAVRVSALNLIDLAGSEKASAHTIDPKIRRKEGSYINKSLLTLGNVISKLSSDDKKNGHIPYRDSKLTRILETSLRGNARIAIICTVSVTGSSFDESNSTLKFASRAKIIKNSARVNEFLDDKSLIRKYRNEINELKKKLSTVMESEENIKRLEELQNQKQLLEDHNNQMLEKLKSQEQEKCALQEKINRLSKLILDSSSVGSSHVFESMMRRNHRSKTKDVDDSDSMIADVPDISNSFPDLDDEEISKISVSGDSVDNILDEEKSNNVQKKNKKHIHNGEERSLLQKTNALLQQKLDLLVHETTRKSQQLLQLQSTLDEKDSQINTLIKTKVEEFQVGNQFSMLQKLLEQKHKQEIAKLEAALLDKQLELELQMADNELMAAQLEDLQDTSSSSDDEDIEDDDDDSDGFVVHVEREDDDIESF